MKKVQTVLLASLAVFALGAVLVTSAFAAEWLEKGTTITTNKPTEAMGGLTLEDTEAPVVSKAAVLCKAKTIGTVGETGADSTTEILNTDGEPAGELGGVALLGTGATSGLGSECEMVTGCAKGTSTSPIEVWPIGLPWTSQLTLEGGILVDELTSAKGAVGYELLCLIFGLNTEDTCTLAKLTIPIINDANGDAEIEAGAETKPLANCTASGKASGKNFADELTYILLQNGELLTAME